MSEHKTVVIDTGSIVSKAGFAGLETPSITFPTVVGKSRSPNESSGLSDVLIGQEAVDKAELLYNKHPIEWGIVTNWEMMEKVWKFIYEEQMGIDSSEHPVLLAETPFTPKMNREKTTQMFFESFNVPALYIAAECSLALFASGKMTGLVVDSGAITHTVAIYEGHVIPYATPRFPVSGIEIKDGLWNHLRTFHNLELPSIKARPILKDIQERLMYVAMDLGEEKKKCEKVDYTLPDGQSISLGEELFTFTEGYFNTNILGYETMSLHETIQYSIDKCDPEVRNKLYGNVLLSGGSTMYKGMKERLEKELNQLNKQRSKEIQVNVEAPSNRFISSWIGGSMLDSLSTFEKMWISKEEYDEVGPTMVHRKCF